MGSFTYCHNKDYVPYRLLADPLISDEEWKSYETAFWNGKESTESTEEVRRLHEISRKLNGDSTQQP